jgi:surface protein
MDVLLRSIPDISGWNTKNIKSMNRLFAQCTSLHSLPDISKWNLINISLICSMNALC